MKRVLDSVLFLHKKRNKAFYKKTHFVDGTYPLLRDREQQVATDASHGQLVATALLPALTVGSKARAKQDQQRIRGHVI